MAKVSKKSTAPVAKKTAKVAKVAKSTKTATPVAKKADTKAVITKRAPNPLMEKLIALMLRKEGAGIADFQTVEGFNLPSMAIVKAAQRAGYKAEASKQPGERTVYKASRP
jgi:hypothetical protein